MSDGPLDAWSSVTEWFVQFAFSVTEDRDVTSVVNDRVVGTSHTRWHVVAFGHLSAGEVFWRGDGFVRGLGR